MPGYEFAFFESARQTSVDGTQWVFGAAGPHIRDAWVLVTGAGCRVIKPQAMGVRSNPFATQQELAEALSIVGSEGWTPVLQQTSIGNSQLGKYLMRRPR